MDKLKKLNRIERETDLLHQAENILESEANRFLDKYYPGLNKDKLSKEQKMEVVETTVSQNKRLGSQEIEQVCRDLEKKQIEKDLHVLLHHRPQFVFFLQNEIKQVEQKFEQVRLKNGINFADPSTIQKVPERELNQMKGLLKQKENLKQSLELMDQLYDDQLHDMYPNWDGRKYVTLEQKECFVMAEEYYGKPLTPEDFSHPPRRYKREEQREIIFLLYQIQQDKSDSYIRHSAYETLRNKYPDFQIDNPSYKQMFFYECLRYKDEMGEERMSQLHHVFDVKGSHLEGALFEDERTFTPSSNPYSSFIHYDGSDFFSILESAIREADRKWREDEFEQQNKQKKKKQQRGMER